MFDTDVLLNMLDRATECFRRGMNAWGCVALNSLLAVLITEHFEDIKASVERGDFLRVADILEHKIRPCLAA